MLVSFLLGAQGQSIYSHAPNGFVLFNAFPPENENIKPNRLYTLNGQVLCFD
jgi:hypothetical protein